MKVLLNLGRHRELLWQFLVRNVKTQHKGSCLGAFWLLANPLLMLGLYTFVFGVVFGGRFGVVSDETTLDYAFGVFLGLTVLNLFSAALGSAPGIIVSQPNFVKKVVFPLEVLPLAHVGALAYNMLISLSLCLFGIIFLGDGLNWLVLWIPLFLIPVLLFSIGVAWFLSAIGVFFRDVAHLTQFLGMVALYGSGVFYSAQTAREVAPEFWMILKWNPLMHVIECLRGVMLWQHDPNLLHLVYIWVAGMLTFVFGAYVFQSLRPGFADAL